MRMVGVSYIIRNKNGIFCVIYKSTYCVHTYAVESASFLSVNGQVILAAYPEKFSFENFRWLWQSLESWNPELKNFMYLGSNGFRFLDELIPLLDFSRLETRNFFLFLFLFSKAARAWRADFDKWVEVKPIRQIEELCIHGSNRRSKETHVKWITGRLVVVDGYSIMVLVTRLS